MLKTFQLNRNQKVRHSSMDSRNLVITSLGSYSEPQYASQGTNGKMKIITGLASKCAKNNSDYFSSSPDIGGISLRSYYNIQTKELVTKHPPRKQSVDPVVFPVLTSELLIIQQSKIALYEAYNSKKKNLRNKYLSFAVSPFGKNKKKYLPKIEKILFKEACKNKEWLSMSMPRILNSLHNSLCRSNGIEVKCPLDAHVTYKYCLGPGNNSKLLKQCLSQRWWWVRVPMSESDSANFVWTQWRDQKFLNSLNSLVKAKLQKETMEKVKIVNEVVFRTSPHSGTSQKIVDISELGFEKITQSDSFTRIKALSVNFSQDFQVHNKIDYNFLLSNKKALFYNLKQYYGALELEVFDYVPVTFHVQGESDKEFLNFVKFFQSLSTEKLWILKPGENTNRGNGIVVVSSVDEVRQEMKKSTCPGSHTFILQKYIEKPFLINKRKFDIRCYALLTSINGVIQCYYYEEGYLRTSSKKYNTADTSDLFIHLTNDAIQKKSENYGKFEHGNKLTYKDLQKYLNLYYPSENLNFEEKIVPKLKSIIKDTVQSVFLKLDPFKRAHTFEVFGYDFLIDESFKPWLIEVNTNPCLELSCSHLARLIPAMIDNALRISIDPLFPEPLFGSRRALPLVSNKFELIFHSLVDGLELVEKLKEKNSLSQIQEINPLIIEDICEDIEGHFESESEENI